jgi:hypothetical protein
MYELIIKVFLTAGVTALGAWIGVSIANEQFIRKERRRARAAEERYRAVLAEQENTSG